MLEPGTVLQRGYVIEKVLGQGGMGAVYLARQDTLGGRRVAIKETTLRVDDPQMQALVDEQFHKEAQILASIDHPNLVDVKDYFDENGAHYLVMAFIDGETLEALLARSPGPLPIDQVLGWMDQLCDVLIVLHEHDPQVLIRDLKPSNVMLDSRGRVRLIDFGIARLEDRSGAKTSTLLKGAGTVGFAPVEQFGGGGTDARSDIYALGATIYALLTRTLPPWSMHLAAGEVALTPPSLINGAVSPPLDAVIMRMMALRRDQRFQTVREARQALRDARATVHEGPVAAVSVPQRFCTQCGSTLMGGQASCPQCGDDLARQAARSSGGWQAPPPPPPPPPAGSGGWAVPPVIGGPAISGPAWGGSGGWGAPPGGVVQGPAGAPPSPRAGGLGPAMIAVVLAVLLGGGWFLFGRKPSPDASGSPSPTAVAVASPSVAPSATVSGPTPQPTPDAKTALDGCSANLALVGSAAEMYRADRGAYPGALSDLAPKYMKAIPTCPAAEEQTYGYTRDEGAPAYTVSCGGWSHRTAGIARNHPLFDSHQGLQTRNADLDLSPRTAQQYYDKGVASWEAGDYKAAVALLEQASSLSPRWAAPHFMVGQCRVADEDFHRAIDAYTQAIGVYRAAAYYNARGHAYAQLADNENALRDYLEADKIRGKDPDTYENVAFALYKMGRFADAIKVCDASLKLDASFADAFVARYWCELCQGDGARAASDAQAHLGLAGWRSYQSPYSVIVAWIAYSMEKRGAEARGIAESALSRLRGDWPYPCVQYLAGVLSEDAMLAQATDAPKQTEAHCYAGMRAAVEGRAADARRHLEWVRDHGHRPYFEYRAALSWLDRLR